MKDFTHQHMFRSFQIVCVCILFSFYVCMSASTFVCNNTRSTRVFLKIPVIILPYGDGSKPCTPGEPQNSW